jgi:hypothetical protein
VPTCTFIPKFRFFPFRTWCICGSRLSVAILVVRYEKLERSFLALNHLAAAIIAFRKVPLNVNITYGKILRTNVDRATCPPRITAA